MSVEEYLSRGPAMGLNTAIVVGDVELHVQTEDLGPKQPVLVTHVFDEGGSVIKVTRLDYSLHASHPRLHTGLAKVMKAHHTKVIRSLQRGRPDSIPPCVVMRPSLAPRYAARPKVPIIDGSLAPKCPPMTEALLRAARTAPVEPAVLAEPEIQGGLTPTLLSSVRAVLSTRANCAGARAVEDLRGPARVPARPTEAAAAKEPPDSAASAFRDGCAALRRDQLVVAVRELALAVHRDPTNDEYRACLRAALARLDVEDSD